MNDLADRRREEKERRRDEILDAAAVVVTEIGYDKLTMGLVAQVARVSRALVYTYFADTQALQWGLCERALDQLHLRFVAGSQGRQSGRDQLDAMGTAYIAFAQEEPVYFEALARFEAQTGQGTTADAQTDPCLAGADRLHRVMTDAIRLGISDGSIRADVGDPDVVATVLWGFMHGVIQLVATKHEVLGFRGITPQQLFAQASAMALASMRGTP